MSGCPVHIWGPMMAAALPFSRTVRDAVRLRANELLHRAPAEPPAPREVHRWAPIAPAGAREDPS
ncbi:MAG: hypothetical protein WC273_00210 [Dehalococcoidia bacterium]